MMAGESSQRRQEERPYSLDLPGAEKVEPQTRSEICVLMTEILDKLGTPVGEEGARVAFATVNAPAFLASKEDAPDIDMPVTLVSWNPDECTLEYNLWPTARDGCRLLFLAEDNNCLYWPEVFGHHFFTVSEDQAQAALADLRKLRQLPRPNTRAGRPVSVLPAAEKRIMTLRDEGFSLRSIADILEAEGHDTPRGGQRWYASTISSIIRRNERAQRD